MWHFLAVQFVPRGVEFHHQLKRKSFEFNEFKEDESGQYVTLKHDTLQETSGRPYALKNGFMQLMTSDVVLLSPFIS